jgi:hypothetical protein
MLPDGRWSEVNASACDQKLAATKSDAVLGRPEGKPLVRVALKSCELGGGVSPQCRENESRRKSESRERQIAS